MSTTPDSTPPVSPSSPVAPATASPAKPPRSLARFTLAALVPALVVVGGVAAYLYFGVWNAVARVNFPSSLRQGMIIPEKLDERFTDVNGNLVADVPTDPKKCIDPPVIYFSPLSSNLKRANETWKEFLVHFTRVTGKKIEIAERPIGVKGATIRMNEGKLHIAGLSTGATPLAVNSAGFIPCCAMADDKGSFAYQMEILVAADTPVQAPADLKGRTIALASMSSLSSFKAPLVMLWREHKMLPGRDYQFGISSGQEDSIKGVCKGNYQAVAVANDLLKRVVAREKLDETKYRSIYKSESYPTACFGYVYTLKPELAKKVREAFLTFDWKGTGLEKAYKPANQTKFVAVSYKKDWENVRAIDKALRELVEQNP